MKEFNLVMTAIFVLWLIVPVADAFIQSKLRETGWKPNYLQLFVIRSMCAILHGALLDTQGGVYGVFAWEWGTLVAYQTTSYWIIFDLVYNYIHGTHVFYRGKESGWLDRMPVTLWYIGKIASLIVLPISFVIYINNYL